MWRPRRAERCGPACRAPALARAGELGRLRGPGVPAGSEEGWPSLPHRPRGLAVSTEPWSHRHPERGLGRPAVCFPSGHRLRGARLLTRRGGGAGEGQARLGMATRQRCLADQEGFLPVCRSLALQGPWGPGSLLAGCGGPATLRAQGLWGLLRQVTPVSSVPSRVTVSVCGPCLSSPKAGLLPSTPSPWPDLIFLQVLFSGWGGHMHTCG